VKSRTCDVLPAIAKIAELAHPDLSLGDRMQRLLTRLELGIPAIAVDLALFAGDSLSRADYLRLTKAQLVTFAAIDAATDEALSVCVSHNKAKMKAIRAASRRARAEQSRTHFAEPILAPYQP
jgi:hypothetical protein